MYKTATCARVLRCGVHTSSQTLLREEATWEEFDSKHMPHYLADGAALLKERITHLSDLSMPQTKDDIKELQFMLEALIEARVGMDTGLMLETQLD